MQLTHFEFEVLDKAIGLHLPQDTDIIRQGMPLLSLEGVSKVFGSSAVLEDIDLTFPQLAVTAVVGRSGCGKSTLLKLCNGLQRPDSGVVSAFDGELDYEDLPALRRRMGYAVQGTGLFPHMNVRQNIVLAARLAGWSKQALNTRLTTLLALTQLDDDLIERYPHQLSGGQQQRVGLCRAMFMQPEILLLDEPFAAIDPITRYDIHQQLLRVLAAEPVTVVLVTHDLREALLLADHIVLMESGRVHLQTSREELANSSPAMEPEQILQKLIQGGEQ